jgi:hypothetical protein
MDTQILRQELHKRVVTVTFKKKNGELREMQCTTNLGLIPHSAWPKGEMKLSEETRATSIRAYDVKAQGWRSFLPENVIDVV